MKNLNLNFRRFEFKYPAPRSSIQEVTEQILNYMVWDEYAENDQGYEVYSLYFDCDEFSIFRDKLNGFKNRKKIRIRTYKNSDGNPIFLEIKRKSGDIILKDRMLIENKHFEDFYRDVFSIFKLEKYRSDFCNEFVYEIAKNQLKPQTLIKYKRKAFFSKFDRNFRLTIDYDIAFGKVWGPTFDTDYKIADNDLALVEVKFNGAMPRWFHNILELCALTKDTFSKYGYGVVNEFGYPNYF